jgi:hypothetical protein
MISIQRIINFAETNNIDVTNIANVKKLVDELQHNLLSLYKLHQMPDINALQMYLYLYNNCPPHLSFAEFLQQLSDDIITHVSNTISKAIPNELTNSDLRYFMQINTSYYDRLYKTHNNNTIVYRFSKFKFTKYDISLCRSVELCNYAGFISAEFSTKGDSLIITCAINE